MVINRGTSVPVSTCQTEQNWTRLPLGALIGTTISYTTPYAFSCVRVTTQRYMHLSPQATESAIRLLDRPSIASTFGDILETEDPAREKMNG